MNYYLINDFGHSGSSAHQTTHALLPRFATNDAIFANKANINSLLLFYIIKVENNFNSHFDMLYNCYKVT